MADAQQQETANTGEDGATVVITHRIKKGQHEAYEAWLNAIGPVCRSFPGHLNWQSIRPVPGMTGTYTMVIRFNTRANLEGWMYSDERKSFVAQVRPLLASDDHYHISTGLDFWFEPSNGTMHGPPRWKQAVVTFIALVPLVNLTPMVLNPLLMQLGLDHIVITSAIGTGVIVILMAYVVMPNFTRLIRKWLYA